MQTALDGREAQAQQRRGFLTRQAFEFPQRQHGAVLRIQTRKGRGYLRTGLRLDGEPFRIRLAPAGLQAKVLDGNIVYRHAPEARRLTCGRVPGDHEQPRPNARLTAKPGQPAPGRQKCLLQYVLGGVSPVRDRAGEAEDGRLVATDQRRERLVVACRGSRDELGVAQCDAWRVAVEHVENPKIEYRGQLPTIPVRSGTTPM